MLLAVGVPPAGALPAGGARSAGTAGSRVTEAQLKVYSDVFNSVIECNQAFAPALRKVKEVYDSCVATSLGFPPVALKAAGPYADEEREVSRSARVAAAGRRLAGPRDAFARLAELEYENRQLR